MKCGFNLLEYKAEFLAANDKNCPECSAKCNATETICQNCGFPFEDAIKLAKQNNFTLVDAPLVTSKTNDRHETKHIDEEKKEELDSPPSDSSSDNWMRIVKSIAIMIIVAVLIFFYKNYNKPKQAEVADNNKSSTYKAAIQEKTDSVDIDTSLIINELIDYYRNEGLKNSCKMEKLTESSSTKLSFYSEDDNFPSDMSIFNVEISKDFIVGDLNNDGISDIYIQTFTSGGWGGGNVTWGEIFVFISKKNKYVLRISPRNIIDYGCAKGASFSISKIENGLLIGESYCFAEDDPQCCASLHYKIKLKFTGKELILHSKEKLK